MNWDRRFAGGAAAVALLAAVLAGCGGDNADKEAIESMLRGVATASTNGDAAAYAAFFTDEGLMDDLGMTREELLAADPEEWADQLRVETITDIEIDGNTAEADVTFVVYESFIARIAPKLVKIDGEWKFNESPGNEFLPAAIPDGVTPVGISMSDFAFGFDTTAPGAGTRAFTFSNKASQDHEAVLFKVNDANLDIPAALAAGEEPESMEFQGFAFAEPGESATMLFVNSLAAGRYAMLCFLPDVNDAAETPHAMKGMLTEFIIP